MHVMISELDPVWLLYVLLFQFEVYPYMHSYLYYKYFSCGGLLTKTNDMLNKNSLGLLKKATAKQSRLKSIAWHLSWLVRTRADISLRPSGLVRPRTDIKLRPSVFVRTRTGFKLQTVGLGRSYKD